MSEPDPAAAAEAGRRARLMGLAVVALISLGFSLTDGPVIALATGAPLPFVAGAIASIVLRSVILGGLVWGGAWFVINRRGKQPTDRRYGPALMGVALAVALVHWGLVTLLTGGADGPQGLAQQARRLGEAHRVALANDAAAFEREAAGGRLTPVAVASRMSGIVDMAMRSPTAKFAAPRSEIAELRAVLARHEAAARTRDLQMRRELEALAARVKDRPALLTAYQDGFGTVGGQVREYWTLNADLLDRTDQALTQLERSRGRWRPGPDGPIFSDDGALNTWRRTLDALRAASERLEADAAIVRDPRAFPAGGKPRPELKIPGG